MTTDRVDRAVTDMFEAASPPLRSGWRERTMTALRDRAGVPPRSRRRSVVVAAFAMVALVGLGFVPFPTRGADGALERAMAAVEQAASLHIITHSSYLGRTSRLEIWWSEDGFRSSDRDLDDGWRQSVEIVDGARRVWYSGYTRHDSVEQRGSERYGPARGPRPHVRFPVERTEIEEMFSWIQSAKGWTIEQRRERSLWGGTIDVIEAEGVASWGARSFPITYAGRDRVRKRAELDADTGRLMSLETYVFDNGSWERTHWTECVEWDVEIPERVRQFEFPEGTTVQHHYWWAERTEETIATEYTQDWEVMLHAVEVNNRGALYVTGSRWGQPSSEIGEISAPSMSWVVTAEGTDQFGRRYVQSGDERWSAHADGGTYWTVVLEPESSRIPPSIPRTVALTIYPCSVEGFADQAVTFRDVRLPPAQKGEALYLESIEVIQY
ncbi:MAG: hypothetical protein IMF16_06025 [Proteobacteria bacterium]|nr:hypothetical protein [Pseudomonadota bacterium]